MTQLHPLTETADVVVVGSGFAGLAATIEAARAGCSVILIEKRDFAGGNSWISGGALAAVDPERQRPLGIADSSRLMAADMLRAGRGINDPELVRLVCMHSHGTLQWLRQDLGVRFMDRIDQLGGHSVPRRHSVESIQGRDIINPMLALADRLAVRMRLDTRMTGLLQGDDRAVVGIDVATADAAAGPAGGGVGRRWLQRRGGCWIGQLDGRRAAVRGRAQPAHHSRRLDLRGVGPGRGRRRRAGGHGAPADAALRAAGRARAQD